MTIYMFDTTCNINPKKQPQIPVIFEGDFWAEEAVRLARAVERRDDGAEETQTPLELCRCVRAVR